MMFKQRHINAGLTILARSRKLALPAMLMASAFFTSVNTQACDGKFTFVGVMKTNDNVVEIYSNKKGPHYTVRDKGGKILATTIDSTELAQNFPHLEPLMTEGHANTLDASLGIQEKTDNVLQIN
ncbi:hypothetical protein TDB9533_03228 [Thalassocella blandensis]|nr:hypothetical protein TDB9533_03228 [Thalassocella blandensis]